jgi:hypothetical protein
MLLAQNRQTEQWNRIENPKINPHSYNSSFFTKDPETYIGKKDSLLHKWLSTYKKLKLNTCLLSCTKIQSGSKILT